MNNKKLPESDWDHLLKKTESELMNDLIALIASSPMGMLPNNTDLKKKVKFWLHQQHERICLAKVVQRVITTPDIYLACAAITDVIGGKGAATVAVLICKIGSGSYYSRS